MKASCTSFDNSALEKLSAHEHPKRDTTSTFLHKTKVVIKGDNESSLTNF